MNSATKSVSEPIHAPVHWFKMGDFLDTKKKAMLAVCGYSKRVWKITSLRDVLSVLAIRDIIISDGRCEEATRCLDFECPLNKTTLKSFREAHGIKSGRAFPKFGQPLDFNKDEEVRKMYAEWVEKYPEGGILRKT
jgi:hypothetical protein